MSAISTQQVVGVIGAGTMGAGIAQVAATAGHQVLLFDVQADAAQKGLDGIRVGLQKRVDSGKQSQQQVDTICGRIEPVTDMAAFAKVALVIEVIIENMEIKRTLFKQLEAICQPETIIASNTSSLSISALAATLERPQQLVGMHFFNPAVVLKLVEVVSGVHTSKEVASTVFATAANWGKTPVHAKSTPGFIVNRIARPFYGEALRALNEQAASCATIDEIMCASGGFRMGPFALMDLIGLDVNLAVSESVYQAYYGDKRFQPSVLQAEMVAGGLLGRKTGRGFYDYNDDVLPSADWLPASSSAVDKITVVGQLGVAETLIALLEAKGVNCQRKPGDDAQGYILIDQTRVQLTDGQTATQVAADTGHHDLVLFDLAGNYSAAQTIAISCAEQASDQAWENANRLFSKLDKQLCLIKDLPGMLVMRTVCCLINEAADAINQGVCSVEDVDTAMKLGVNYPQGPIEWGQRLGFAQVVSVLRNLQSAYGEERYRCSAWLLNQRYFI